MRFFFNFNLQKLYTNFETLGHERKSEGEATVKKAYIQSHEHLACMEKIKSKLCLQFYFP
jgi:hypothetical protein